MQKKNNWKNFLLNKKKNSEKIDQKFLMQKENIHEKENDQNKFLLYKKKLK